uniref:MDM2 binding protein n=1 Tax=Salarias fasciatus TaxID=181472 RepID=A0A672FMG3_SALFA
MDRYVLITSFGQADDSSVWLFCTSHSCFTVSPACSLSGSPAAQRWYFAVQVCHGESQFCSSDWEDLGSGQQKSESEEEKQTALEACLTSLKTHIFFLYSLCLEITIQLRYCTNELEVSKALVDVLVLVSTEQSPPMKDLLPLLGALKHMSCWHNAKITVVTQHATGWQRVASSLGAGLVDPAELSSCIDRTELWRGALLVREKKFTLPYKVCDYECVMTCSPQTHTHTHTVFHYYAPALDLVQLVKLSDLPSFLLSSTHFELGLSGKSMKAQLLLDQLRSLRGKVGALFSLSCVITPVAQPASSQLSSQRWRETLARRPKSLQVPDVEVKGESAVYFLLVQGSDDAGSAACRVRMLHSDSQINGAAAMATVSGLLREMSLSSSAGGSILRPLPCLQGNRLLERERKVTQVQTLVLKEYLRRRGGASVPVNDLKVILNQAREQYLKMAESGLPSAATCLTDSFQTLSHPPSEWPERTVLLNIENLQRKRQRKRFGLLGPGSSDSLLGPKDCQRGSPALLDAKELLKHFTADGLPTAELQPLAINRGINVFQLSPDLSPRRVTNMPFSKASASHYHGIDFCLDNQRSLERDQTYVRLQSRLIRYETQTTCSKEPCALPFALSPAPSPAVLSEPGSVPDGETLQNNKRRGWEADIVGGRPHKRLVKSESSESLCSQSSGGGGGTHPVIRSLRQHPSRSQSVSSSSSFCTATRRASGTVSGVRSMLQEVVAKTLKHHGIAAEHESFEACSKRLFDISKFYLKDLKTSRGLHDEMKKAASSNVKQVIDWVLEKMSKKR